MNTPILVVEDDPMVAKLLKDYLVANGFAPAWLNRGDLVCDWLERNPAEPRHLLTEPGVGYRLAVE